MSVHLPALPSTPHIVEISPHTSRCKHSPCPQLPLPLEPERLCRLMKRQWIRSGDIGLVVLTLLLTSSETLNNSLCKMKVAQMCPNLCDPMDYTVHGILQARILEWVANPFFRGTSQTTNQTGVSCIAGGFFTS